MITGKLMFDVEIAVNDEAELQNLSKQIEKVVSQVDTTKVLSCEEIDSDIQEESE